MYSIHDKATMFRLSYMTAMIEDMVSKEIPKSARHNAYAGIRDKIVKALDLFGMNRLTGDDIDKAMKVFETTDRAIARAYPAKKARKQSGKSND